MSVRVFIGSSGNGEDAEFETVCEYTLRKHASVELDVTWMKPTLDPYSFWYAGQGGWNMENWSTPFSGFRWGIPAACDYEGEAIYMDYDMLIQDDIANLWNQPWRDNETCLISKGGPEGWRFCVMKMRCDRIKDHMIPIDRLKSNPAAFERMKNFFATRLDLRQDFEGNWNCIDGENYESMDDPEVKIIHYSDMSSQPHLPLVDKRIGLQNHWYNGKVRHHWRDDLLKLFEDTLNEAIKAGFSVADHIPNMQFGHYNKGDQSNYRANHTWEPQTHA